jgi:hypothetical protein
MVSSAGILFSPMVEAGFGKAHMVAFSLSTRATFAKRHPHQMVAPENAGIKNNLFLLWRNGMNQ